MFEDIGVGDYGDEVLNILKKDLLKEIMLIWDG